MRANYREYLMQCKAENIEEMSCYRDMIITRLENVLEDVRRSLKNTKQNDFNSIDTMCYNVSSDLIMIARYKSKVGELMTLNSTITAVVKEDENE